MLPQRQQYPRPALPLRSLLCLVRKTLRSRFAPSHPAAWSALKPAVPDPPAVWEFSARVRGITGQNDACNFFLLFLEQEILRISGSGIPLAFLMAIPLFPPGLVMLMKVLLGTVCSGRISGRIFRILALGIALCPAWSAALEAENASGEEMALPGPDAPLKGVSSLRGSGCANMSGERRRGWNSSRCGWIRSAARLSCAARPLTGRLRARRSNGPGNMA